MSGRVHVWAYIKLPTAEAYGSSDFFLYRSSGLISKGGKTEPVSLLYRCHTEFAQDVDYRHVGSDPMFPVCSDGAVDRTHVISLFLQAAQPLYIA
jgi:hypothetical protein